MTKNPESYNLEEILAGYVLGNLEEEERVWLNRQLAINPQLQEQIQQLQISLNLIPYGLSEDIMPPSNLREKIFPQHKSLSTSTNYLHYLGWIIGGITTITALWLGINNYGLRKQIALGNQQLQYQQELIALMRQPNNLFVSLKGSQQLPQASGSLLVSPQKHRAVLSLQNLEPLSGKQVYRLWAVSQEKKIGCINFTPDQDGRVHVEFSDNALKEANAVIITIEPEVNTIQPQGNTMMTGYYSIFREQENPLQSL